LHFYKQLHLEIGDALIMGLKDPDDYWVTPVKEPYPSNTNCRTSTKVVLLFEQAGRASFPIADIISAAVYILIMLIQRYITEAFSGQHS